MAEAGRLDKIWRKAAHDGPMEPLERGTLQAGGGLDGDVQFGSRRPVTIVDRRRWQEACVELGAEVDPVARRANLLVSGVDLESSRGRILRVGPARIRVLGETRPCSLMDEAHPGLQAALTAHWRAGAYGEVVEGGAIAVGDPVGWE
jgi:MOSC domain-containing protein YiiM